LTPAWAVTVIETSSISTISSSPPRSITMPPRIGRQPPWVPEPPPQGTTGTRCSSAIRTTSATCSSVRGRTTTSGRAIGAPAAAACSAGQYVSATNASSRSGAVETASPSALTSASSTLDRTAGGVVVIAKARFQIVP
jgi:hypothetical protein